MVCAVILADLVFEKKRGIAKLVLVNRHRSAAQIVAIRYQVQIFNAPLWTTYCTRGDEESV